MGGRRRSDGERYGAGRGLVEAAAGRPVVEQRAPASECRDHTVSAPETFEILLHRCRKCPHSRAGSVGGRCQNSLYDNGIRRHRPAPGHVHDRRRHPAAARGRRPRAVDPAPGRDRGQPDRPGPAAAPDHRARAAPRPPRRPPRPRRGTTVPPTPPPGGPTRPGRPNGTPSVASPSRTRWTTTTSRSGTRWPPASVSEEQAVVIVKGVDALPVEHRRDAEDHLIGLARRARPGRAAPARTPRPRSGRPRDRRRPPAQGPATPGSPRRGSLPVHHRRRRPRPVPRPVHPPGPGRGDAEAGGARDQLTRSTGSTPAPPRGSGTRSASTSPATRPTGSPRPAAWTPPWWSP